MPVTERIDLLRSVYCSSIGVPVLAEMAASVYRHAASWHERSLSASYPLLIGDRVSVSLRAGTCASRPVHTVLGVTPQGDAELLGVWASVGPSVSESWRHIASELHVRGVRDVSTVVSLDGPDGENLLVGWPDASVVRPSSQVGDRVGWLGSM